MCVCLCVCMHLRVCVCVCKCIHGSQRPIDIRHLSLLLSILLWDRGSHCTTEVTNLSGLAGQPAARICLTLFPQGWDFIMLNFVHRCWGLNPGPLVCSTSTFLAEPSPQPLSWFFMERKAEPQWPWGRQFLLSESALQFNGYARNQASLAVRQLLLQNPSQWRQWRSKRVVLRNVLSESSARPQDTLYYHWPKESGHDLRIQRKTNDFVLFRIFLLGAFNWSLSVPVSICSKTRWTFITQIINICTCTKAVHMPINAYGFQSLSKRNAFGSIKF